jgi:trans-aconitate methyltransferase
MTKWNAGDYAKHSLGQFAWAMSLIERLNLAPDDHVLDIGCGDGKVAAEIERYRDVSTASNAPGFGQKPFCLRSGVYQ